MSFNGKWLLIAAIFVVLVLIIWAQKSTDHPFDIRDTLMDSMTNKASLNAMILAVMAVMAIWVVIYLTLHDKDVENIILGVLAIFVLGRLGYQGIEKFKPGGWHREFPREGAEYLDGEERQERGDGADRQKRRYRDDKRKSERDFEPLG